MPLKFTMEEQRPSIDADAAVLLGPAKEELAETRPVEQIGLPIGEPLPPPLPQADIYAFQGSVLTLRGLGEEYQQIKARVEKGEAYLRANVKLPTVKGWLEQMLALEYTDERAAAIGERVVKLQPPLATAIALLLELRAKLVDLDRRVGLEADRQHELEVRIAGEGKYICTHCWRVSGPGQCRCWEDVEREKAAMRAGE